jgi:glycerophosphoryl diester phosphodiesterase
MAAFELALQEQADGIELDVKLCGDGHVVVMHDQSVDRTTNGTGQVKDLSLAELKRLDAGLKFNPSYSGEMIPTLEEVLNSFSQRTFINIELTNYASVTDSLPEKVAELVKQYAASGSVMYSSFNPLALRRIRRLTPDVPLGLLAFQGRKGAWARGPLGRWLVRYQALHPELNDVDKNLVVRIHREGKRVNTYTVNDPEDMRYLTKIQVDGIFTDDPLLARQVLTQFH